MTELGHEVIVAHAQKVRLIVKSRKKDDRIDARTLARLARIDPQLLSLVQHRSAEAQIHFTEIRARAEPVRARTALVNSASTAPFVGFVGYELNADIDAKIRSLDSMKGRCGS